MRMLVAIAAVLSASGLSHLEAQAPTGFDILPPVIIRGETPASTKLADRMAALRVPGVSVAVIHAGKIEWARGFGVASFGGAEVDPNTLFQAASISKAVTAMAVLRLVQAGQLDLDKDVNQYLRTWKVPANSFTDKTKVTMRELLTHTAGMTVHGFPGYASDARLPTLVQILNGEKPANTPAITVDMVPGTEWRYSGGGFVVAQLALQDVTGEPFPAFMKENVLGPVGMGRSTYEQPLPQRRMGEAAMAYRQNGQAVPGGPHVYPEMAPAALWTTPSDLARYAMEIQKALAGKSTVLSAAMAREMVTPGKGKWGIGIGTGGSPAHRYFEHSGANDGFQCNLVAYNDGDGAVIMTNSDNGGQLAAEILRTIAYEYKWPDFAPHEIQRQKDLKISGDTLAKYTGVYGIAPGVYVTVTLADGQLISQMSHQNQIPLIAQSETRFAAKLVDAQIEFLGSEKGPASELVLHQGGRDMTAKRLDDAEAKRVRRPQRRSIRGSKPKQPRREVKRPCAG